MKRRIGLATASAAAVVAVIVAGFSWWAGSDNVTTTGLRDLTDAEQIVVEHAEQLLVKRCMERDGFQYSVGPVPSLEQRQGNGYVLSDVDWARKHGYGRKLDEEIEKIALGDPNAAHANTLPQPDLVRYQERLDGVPAQGVLSVDLPTGGTIRTIQGGCRREAAEQLYGDFPTWFRTKTIATNLTGLYAPDIIRDERFGRALTAWAQCMRDAGHPYSDPPEIRKWRDGIGENMSPDEVQAAEVEVAVAEATCAGSTPLLDTARALELEYRAQRLAPYQDDIITYQRMGLAALARARTITGHAP
ncbi:hypothetical protein F4560_003061 [Saccharothrix ecbatanensis]|uniref:Uncharacterized protein n=1 Tax=Saccharothrix ecbatanensis TaxID=1105145 RepID=A0A7W9M0Y1_9PSEU|nr:hypothetical protein [Saccharothrix ecbatanensis]MBB5803293.1 hypothetical protein [Saccharothrix ecbatanensis]